MLDQYEKCENRKMVKINFKSNVKSSYNNSTNYDLKSSEKKKKKKTDSSKNIILIRSLRDDYYHLGFDVDKNVNSNYNRKSHGADLKNDYFKNKKKEHGFDKSDEYVNFQTEVNLNQTEKVKSAQKTYKSNLKMRSANKSEDFNTNKIVDKFTTFNAEDIKTENNIQENSKNNSNNFNNNNQKKHLTFKTPEKIPKKKDYNILSKSGGLENSNNSGFSNGENSHYHSHHKFILGESKLY